MIISEFQGNTGIKMGLLFIINSNYNTIKDDGYIAENCYFPLRLLIFAQNPYFVPLNLSTTILWRLNYLFLFRTTL